MSGEIGMQELILSEQVTVRAAKKYLEGDFSTALRLYELAAKRYGEQNFEVNISLCKKAMEKAGGEQAEIRARINKIFDRVYLVNLKKEAGRRLQARHQMKRYCVDYQLVDAVDGYQGEPLDHFKSYKDRPLGKLTRYPAFNEREVNRKKHFIESAGAIGYIYTYLNILKDAKANGHKKILILEDDVIFHEDFDGKFEDLIQRIGNDWKVLQLGASQYNWESVDEERAVREGFYFPRQLDTCGSFAIGLDESIFEELIAAESAFDAPFDHLPLGEIYERHLGRCYVAYPNIVMPDVTGSSIRGTRCQYEHGKRMRWRVTEFPFPLPRPTVAILLKSKRNLEYLSDLSKKHSNPCVVNFYWNTIDGLRPVHNLNVVEYDYNDQVVSGSPPILPEFDFVLTLDADDILTESDIVNYVDNSYDGQSRATNLRCVSCESVDVVKGRVSVIIPTYKRPDNLRSALISVAGQDYADTEILVVSDNPPDSEYILQTHEIVEDVRNSFPKVNVRLIQHNRNRNGAAARNSGIMRATGEFLCFLDDDDIYLEGRISSAVAMLQQAGENLKAVYCGFLGWNSPKNNPDRYKEGDLTRELLLLNYKAHYLHTNTATYRRNAVLAINGFDESYRRHQDIEFNLRFLKQFKFGVVKETLVRLNPAPSTVSNKAYGAGFIEIKCKFLSEFSQLIFSFGKEFADDVLKAHHEEIRRYTVESSGLDEYFSGIANNFHLGIFRFLSGARLQGA